MNKIEKHYLECIDTATRRLMDNLLHMASRDALSIFHKEVQDATEYRDLQLKELTNEKN